MSWKERPNRPGKDWFGVEHSQCSPGEFGMPLVQPHCGELVEGAKSSVCQPEASNDGPKQLEALGPFRLAGLPQQGGCGFPVQAPVALRAGGWVAAEQFEGNLSSTANSVLVKQERVGGAVQDGLKNQDCVIGIVGLKPPAGAVQKRVMTSLLRNGVKQSADGRIRGPVNLVVRDRQLRFRRGGRAGPTATGAVC